MARFVGLDVSQKLTATCVVDENAALKMQMNKTDQNDAEGLAQIMHTGWYRPVRCHVAAATSKIGLVPGG